MGGWAVALEIPRAEEWITGWEERGRRRRRAGALGFVMVAVLRSSVVRRCEGQTV